MPVDRASEAILGLVIIFLFVFTLYVIPSLITTWKLYAKAGKPGWAVLIPVYSSVVLAEISKKPVWIGWTLGIISLINGKYAALGLVTLVLFLILLSGFVKQYDRKLGFWVLYIFLPIVAVFMVDQAKYIGGSSMPASTGAASAPQPIAVSPPSPVESPRETKDSQPPQS